MEKPWFPVVLVIVGIFWEQNKPYGIGGPPLVMLCLYVGKKTPTSMTTNVVHPMINPIFFLGLFCGLFFFTPHQHGDWMAYEAYGIGFSTLV